MTDLPQGWEWARLRDIAHVRLGRQRSPKNHTGTQMRPYLRAANVGWNGLKLDDVKRMNFTDSELSTYRLNPGDIVLAEASGTASEVGKPALWMGEIKDCCFQNTLIRVRSRGVDPSYLLEYLRNEARTGAFIGRSRGVGIHHLGSTRLAEWSIPVPPIAEQRRIATAISTYQSTLDSAESLLATAVKRSRRLYRTVVAHALSGNLATNLSSDEPASALLSAIRHNNVDD